MKAMVLAAGQGTRLRPITDRMPKALVPVAGRPMIEFALLLLRHYGVRDIVINLHHFGGQIEDHLGDGQRFDVKISYSHETELLETGGGLLKAKPFLQQDTFIVINTDALIDVDLAAVLNGHRQNHAAATLVLRPDVDADRYGSIDIGADGRIVALRVARGSGHAVLDQQALEMFRNAKPQVLIPGELRGREFELELRAVYSLRDPRSG